MGSLVLDGGIHDGVPYRTHRLKAAGNAIVPGMVSKAWNHFAKTIGGKENEES